MKEISNIYNPPELTRKEGLLNSNLLSTTDFWATPKGIFEAIQKYLNVDFCLDVCAIDENVSKCHYFISQRNADSLAVDWMDAFRWVSEKKQDTDNHKKFLWMNPPYSHMKVWMKKAYESGAPIACLIKSDTSTLLWPEYIVGKAAMVIFLVRRVNFEDQHGDRQSNNFANCVVVYDGLKHNDTIYEFAVIEKDDSGKPYLSCIS